MSRLLSITEGHTRRLTFTLTSKLPTASAVTAFDGTGFTLSNLYITGKDATIVDTAGDFGWVSAADGTVYYDPDASDFVASKSPYVVKYEVTDGAGKVECFPSADADEILVKPLRK